MSKKASRAKLRRWAKLLRVSPDTLRAHGWAGLSDEQIKQQCDDPPDWLTKAQTKRKLRRERDRDRQRMLSASHKARVFVHSLREHNITPDNVGAMLAAQPDWLAPAQAHYATQMRIKERGALRKELLEVLVEVAQYQWLDMVRIATSPADLDAADRWLTAELRSVELDSRRIVRTLPESEVRTMMESLSDESSRASQARAQALANYVPPERSV